MDLVVVGAGGHAKVVIATARAAGHSVVAVLDDNPERIGKPFEGLLVAGPITSYSASPSASCLVVAIGDNRVRAKVAASLLGPFATLIHPFSWVAPDAEIGVGTVVLAGTIVHPSARIGRHCVLNTACSVDHDCRMEDFSQVAPGAHLAGGVRLGEGTHVGMGANVIQGLTLGAWSVVGAGAAVIRDVPADTLVKGVPARSNS